MTTRSGNTRVVLIEDHALFAQSLGLALSLEGHDVHWEPLPADGTTVGELLHSVSRREPRIVLLDLDLGTFGDGTVLIRPLAKMGIAVVVVTACADTARWGQCVRYGVSAVLTKTQPLPEILAVVGRLARGESVMEVDERRELLRQWYEQEAAHHTLQQRLDRLTHREQVVLGKLSLGLQVREIAAEAVVSEATVRTQVRSILAKLEVSSQLAAVGLARRLDWRPPD